MSSKKKKKDYKNRIFFSNQEISDVLEDNNVLVVSESKEGEGEGENGWKKRRKTEQKQYNKMEEPI